MRGIDADLRARRRIRQQGERARAAADRILQALLDVVEAAADGEELTGGEQEVG